jgi:hypothetical protein
MDSVEKRIQAYLSKIPKQKVELGAVEDFKKAAGFVKQSRNTYNKVVQEFVNLLNQFIPYQAKLKDAYFRAKDFADDVEEDIQRLQKAADKIAAAAKDLGIQPKEIVDTSIVNDVADVEDTINIARQRFDDAKAIIKI